MTLDEFLQSLNATEPPAGPVVATPLRRAADDLYRIIVPPFECQ
jgi:hypothetical protein